MANPLAHHLYLLLALAAAVSQAQSLARPEFDVAWEGLLGRAA
jgi:methylmalonyl-CoA mutase N-terminal domain/subunit